MPATLTLVFDDGYQHIFDTVLPELNRRHLSGVFAVPLDGKAVAASEHLPTTPWESWLLHAHGHEIAAHSSSHRDLTTLSDDELIRELAEPATKLGATTLIYPGGAYDARVIAAARQHYTAARTVRYGFATIPPHDWYQLQTVNYTRSNWSLLRANARVLWAILTNRWLIETYHIVSDTITDGQHSVSLSDFKRHLDFIARVPIAVKTIKQVTANHP